MLGRLTVRGPRPPRARRALALGATVSSLAVLVGCADGRAAAAAIEVISTSDACTPKTTELAAGSVTFRLVNRGGQPTELYVLEPSGKVVSEVENVGPGTARNLTVDLAAGDYDLVCKPGQAGNGIRQAVSVTGDGGSATPTSQPTPDRTIAVTGRDYHYEGELSGIRAGETVRFMLHNAGTVDHELEILGPDGQPRGEIGPTAPNGDGELVITFGEAGRYQAVCGITGHEEMGMVTPFTVTERTS